MLLEARDIRKSYGSLEVLHGVNLAVTEGETFAIIGPNGAGKTTLFKVLTGESPANGGTVLFRGADVTGMPAFRRARAGFGRTFQVARVFAGLDLLTNVVVPIEARLAARGEAAGPWWDWRPSDAVRREAQEILESFGFERRRWSLDASTLSHGDRKRLEFAVTLATRPEILMLDEPTAGMSPPDRKAMTRLLKRMKAERGMTIVMTEHDMDIIFELADRLMVLNYGAVIAIGAPATVRDDPTVRQVYLGQAHGHA